MKKAPLMVGVFVVAGFLIVFLPNATRSETMTSTNYIIQADVLSVSGASSTSSNYILTDTAGEFFATNTLSSTYILRGGFWNAAEGRLTVGVSNNTLSLGSLARTSVRTVSHTITVTSTVNAGYTMQITEDGNLRTAGGADIDDVADGAVSVDFEEYGFSTAGTDGQYNGTDTAITGAYKTVATRSSRAPGIVTTLTYKAGVGALTAEGTFSHTVTIYVTANL